MSMEIKAPSFPESVADGTVATWHKQPGEACSRDELIVDIETDKVVMEVVAPADGTVAKIIKGEGDTVLSDEVIATFEAGEVSTAAAAETTTETVVETATDAGDVSGPAVRKLLDENRRLTQKQTDNIKHGPTHTIICILFCLRLVRYNSNDVPVLLPLQLYLIPTLITS